MVLIDKGYYDYDYEEPKGAKYEKQKVVTIEETKKSDEEVENILAAFGFGRKKEPMGVHDAQALQELVIKDLKIKRGESLE